MRRRPGQGRCPHLPAFLQELLAIQEDGAKNIGFFGTRNMGFLHQQLIEILSYAMVLTGNHIYTSGGLGTNAAVIRGAKRAEKPELLTVILPQSLERQPEELHELLRSVKNLKVMSENDGLTLLEASKCAALVKSPATAEPPARDRTAPMAPTWQHNRSLTTIVLTLVRPKMVSDTQRVEIQPCNFRCDSI
jgi:hypothetical protein